MKPPTPDEMRMIRKRHEDWADAEWGTDDDSLHEHPDTECSADRDRAALLALLDASTSEKRQS